MNELSSLGVRVLMATRPYSSKNWVTICSVVRKGNPRELVIDCFNCTDDTKAIESQDLGTRLVNVIFYNPLDKILEWKGRFNHDLEKRGTKVIWNEVKNLGKFVLDLNEISKGLNGFIDFYFQINN